MTAAETLVLGATGRTGRPLVERLRARGVACRALVRDAGRASAMLAQGIVLIEGDLRDEGAIVRATSGCTQAVFVAGGFTGRAAGSPREVDFAAVAMLAQAMRRTGGRLVLLSSAAVTQPEHPHNCSFDGVLRWKLRGEKALRQSGLDYTIVRALGLRDRPGGTAGIRLVQGDRIAFGEDIARDDLATLLADIIAPPPGSGLGNATLCRTTVEVFNENGEAGYRLDLPLRADVA